MTTEQRVPVLGEEDVVVARQAGRRLAEELGMSSSLQIMVATAISEVARNIVTYAGRGEVLLSVVVDGSRRCIEVTALDSGPGIVDLELAMRDGYSTARSLGLGLPGARRLMDEFSIDSAAGSGTRVVMRKWLPDQL